MIYLKKFIEDLLGRKPWIRDPLFVKEGLKNINIFGGLLTADLKDSVENSEGDQG